MAARTLADKGRQTECWPPLMIGSEIYRRSRYGSIHPLAIPRVSTVIDLCHALGWLEEDSFVDSPTAGEADLARYHDPSYVAAVRQAEHRQAIEPEERDRYNLGRGGNPIFGEVFRRPATSAGATMLAAHLLREGGVVHSPAGGTHHALPDQASGFCYFNDPVLGILTMLDLGLERIVYVDIDAHHGDGVELAFDDEPRVLTISVHEANRWPRSGPVSHRGTAGTSRNLPVPEGLNDDEMLYLLDHVILPLAQRFRPQAIVLQCGADALQEDPLSRLALSNNAHVAVLRALRPLTKRLLVLGGGGYNPWTVARCWTRIWGTLTGQPAPRTLPPEAELVLRQLTWHRAAGRNPPEPWFTTLADVPRWGPIRPEIKAIAKEVIP